MKRRFISRPLYKVVPICLFFLCSCFSSTPSSSVIAEKNQLKKPHVALFPLIDRSKRSFAWSLSDELSELIEQRLSKRDHITLGKIKETRAFQKTILGKKDPFSYECSWISEEFSGYDFVVFLELLEHRQSQPQALEGAAMTNSSLSDALKMRVRIRVFDLRKSQLKIVLQEVVSVTHHLPSFLKKTDFKQVAWGSKGFEVSPLGMAHAKLIKEITNRVEDYILISGQYE